MSLPKLNLRILPLVLSKKLLLQEIAPEQCSDVTCQTDTTVSFTVTDVYEVLQQLTTLHRDLRYRSLILHIM